jgi:hypothetical protein
MKNHYHSAICYSIVILLFCLSYLPIHGQILYTIGSGTGSNTGSTYPTPYGNWFMGNRLQMIYRASELTAAGASAGVINSIAFNVVNLNSVPGLDDFEIKIKNSTTNNLDPAFETGLTTVFTSASYTPTMGWNTHTFSTPFLWDGTSNIIIEICSQNPGWLSNGNASVEWTENLPMGTSRTYRADNLTVCSNAGTSNLNPTNRPNARFAIISEPCESDPQNLALDSVNAAGNAYVSWTSPGDRWIVEYGPCGFTPGAGQATYVDTNATINTSYMIPGVTLGTCGCMFVKEVCDTTNSNWSDSLEICNPYTLDLEMRAVLSPFDYICGASNMPVIIEVRNNGIDPVPIHPVQVFVTGDYTQNFSFTGPSIQPGDFAQVNLGTINTIPGGVVNIEARAILPGDQFRDNDTLRVTRIIRSSEPIDFQIIGFGNLEVGFVANRKHDTINWDFGGLGTASGDSVVYTFPAVDSFQVCMEVVSSCGGGNLCKWVYANTVSTIDWEALEKRVRVYPNPSNGIVQINMPSALKGNWNVEVINSLGQTVRSSEFFAPNVHSLNLEPLPKGHYTLRMSSDYGVIHRRVLLQ